MTIQSAFILLISAILFNCRSNQNKPDVLNSFRIEEGFQIELMAMEPLIADPVDMEIDELGRWYVVEMHGYPLDVSGSGKVKRLLDTDGDGLPDKSTIFIDSLILPTGIMRWKKGFLVTDPPNVLYLEDTDNDGRADIREIVLTGFARSNPQHNVNNPLYGIDNWIYLSHEGAIRTKTYSGLFGDRGNDVCYPNLPEGPRLPQNANGLGVRFKPGEGLVEMLSAKGQFGHTFDPWGHHFLTSNADHLFHEVISSAYIQRNKNLLIPNGRVYIPKSGKGFEIYPITENPDHQLLTDVGMITSACGITWYQGGIFPEEYNNTIFTAEPVHNMIHVDKIVDKGATFEAINLFDDREFLASKDSWFRPVNHYIGPDGALYVLDYHRKIIEHPEWLSDEVINSGDLYAGKEQGRIYRITPKGTPATDFLDNVALNSYDTNELIKLLNHSNGWWRINAQRLLMDRSDPKIALALEKSIATDLNEFGKIHAMWLLQGKSAMTTQVLLSLLADESPNVREQAIKIAETRLSGSEELVTKLLAMKADPNDKVRYQLLLTLGELASENAESIRTEMLFNDIENEWTQYAALSARQPDIINLYNQSCLALAEKESEHTRLFFSRMSETLSRGADSKVLNSFMTSILRSSEKDWYIPTVLDGISNVLGRNNELSVSQRNIDLLKAQFSEGTNTQIRTQSIELLNQIGYFQTQNNELILKASAVLEEEGPDPEYMNDALRIIARTDADKHLALFNSILLNQTNTAVRMTAVEAFGYTKDPHSLNRLIAIWPHLLPDERSKGVGILLRNDEGKWLLVKSIQSGQMNAASLSWPQTVQLLNSSNPEIRELARSVLSGNELSSDSIWNAYKGSLSLEGSSVAGEGVFRQSCGTCHQRGGKNGTSFGPDLASVQNRSNSSLLLDILQPNRSIADGYELWQLELNNGNGLTGVIASEGPSSVTIRMMGGQEQTINRKEIKSLLAFENSAMPKNLQAGMSPQEMADLLAYLKNN